MFDVTGLLEVGGKIIDKLIPDPAAKAKAQLDLATLAQNGELAKMANETEIYKTEQNNVAVARSKLMLEQRRWWAEKLRPKVYGPKLAIGGAAELPPIHMTKSLDVSNLSIEELEVLAAALEKSIATDGQD